MDDVLSKLTAWAEGDGTIRALILTSTRAQRGGPPDPLSDYDVIAAVTDTARFGEQGAWVDHYGRPIGRWSDEGRVLGVPTFFRGVVYDDGTKVDYTIWPDRLLDDVGRSPSLPPALDVGYRVLLDKEGRTSGWPDPTFQAHIPPRPTEDEYRALIAEFWWGTTYVAKALRRGEVFFAKFALDHDLKHDALRRLLEWRIELDHGWAWKPGAYGRGLERVLPEDILGDLSRTWVGMGVQENWNALFDTVALFRRVACEVGAALAFEYPADVDAVATAHLESVRALEA